MARIDDFNRIVQNITRNQNIIDTIAQAAKLGTSYLNQIPYELLTPSYIDTITNAQASIFQANQLIGQCLQTGSFATSIQLASQFTMQDYHYLVTQIPQMLEASRAFEVAHNCAINLPAGLEKFNSLYQSWSSLILCPATVILPPIVEQRGIIYDRVRAVYIKELYNANWCPFIYEACAISLVEELNEIILHTRQGTKSRQEKFDQFVFKHFDKKYISWLKKEWKKSQVPVKIRRTLRHILDDYEKREYAVVVVSLSTMWEGLIADMANLEGKAGSKQLKEAVKQFTEANDYTDAIAQYYDNFVLYHCYNPDQVKSDSPGRHYSAHGWWYSNYPTKKAALNAILFTDFLLAVKAELC